MSPVRLAWVALALACAVALVGGTRGLAQTPTCANVGTDKQTVLDSRDPTRECILSVGVSYSDPTSDGKAIIFTIRTISGAPEGRVGFVFGDSSDAGGDHGHYTFAIDQQGDYGLTYRVGSQVTDLVAWSRSSLVKTGANAVNELSVVTSDNVIRCFINGEYAGGAATATHGGELRYYTAGVTRAQFEEVRMLDHPQPASPLPVPGHVLLSDDLVTQRTFQSGGSSICRAGYDAEGYVVQDVAARGLCDLPLVAAGTFTDQVRFEVDMKLRAGPLNHSYGLFFARQPGAAPMFIGTIDGEGIFQFAQRDGTWQRLNRQIVQSQIRTGLGAWNHLIVSLHGLTMRGFVNGGEMARIDATRALAGGIGFYLDEPGMVAVFRNLTVTQQ